MMTAYGRRTVVFVTSSSSGRTSGKVVAGMGGVLRWVRLAYRIPPPGETAGPAGRHSRRVPGAVIAPVVRRKPVKRLFILALVLGVGTAPAADPLPPELQLVPPDAAVFVHVDAAAIWKSKI